MLQTEVPFTLPKGYLDEHGTLHKDGVMRLATAADEILPLREAAVERNPAYLTVIVLSRVLTRLGDVQLITPSTIEKLFATDLAYLQDLYNDINHPDEQSAHISCPECHNEFELERQSAGES
jgi:hypothetical protein